MLYLSFRMTCIIDLSNLFCSRFKLQINVCRINVQISRLFLYTIQIEFPFLFRYLVVMQLETILFYMIGEKNLKIKNRKEKLKKKE